jgi:hypothetical protein
MKVKTPDGRQVEAVEVDYTPVREDWNEYKLSDGTTLKMKTVVTRVMRTEQVDLMTGDPQYIVTSTNIVRVTNVPADLKKTPRGRPSTGQEVA